MIVRWWGCVFWYVGMRWDGMRLGGYIKVGFWVWFGLVYRIGGFIVVVVVILSF